MKTCIVRMNKNTDIREGDIYQHRFEDYCVQVTRVIASVDYLRTVMVTDGATYVEDSFRSNWKRINR